MFSLFSPLSYRKIWFYIGFEPRINLRFPLGYKLIKLHNKPGLHAVCRSCPLCRSKPRGNTWAKEIRHRRSLPPRCNFIPLCLKASNYPGKHIRPCALINRWCDRRNPCLDCTYRTLSIIHNTIIESFDDPLSVFLCLFGRRTKVKRTIMNVGVNAIHPLFDAAFCTVRIVSDTIIKSFDSILSILFSIYRFCSTFQSIVKNSLPISFERFCRSRQRLFRIQRHFIEQSGNHFLCCSTSPSSAVNS